MGRNPDGMKIFEWAGDVEIVQGDAFDPESLKAAMEGVSAAFYLIHSMAAGKGFEQRDIAAAENFAQAAKSSGLKRIIYLGGLGKDDPGLSSHLASRHEVGRILAGSGADVTEFRAAVIVGAGSLSFEMIRYLTERLPLMICPKWVFTKIQPISIDDVLGYLTAAITNEESAGRVIEIGGKDILTYRDLMLIYARQRGLKRFIIRVPVLSPRLSSYWVHLVTPIPSSMAIPLIEGVKNEVVVCDDQAARIFTDIHPRGYEDSVKRALEKLHPDRLSPIRESRFHEGILPHFCIQKEGMIVESKTADIEASPEDVFRVVESLGGENGWWGLERVWYLRGILDRIFGGEGFISHRSGRHNAKVGDQIDFLDVEKVVPLEELLLKVRFKLPGAGWMRFKVDAVDSRKSRLDMTVYFAPKGLRGIAYWYFFLPVHRIVFNIMLKKIKSQASTSANGVK